MNVQAVFVVVAIVFSGVVAVDYCKICKDHTMCIYKGVGPTCAPKLGGGVSASDKAAILQAHNDFRQRVAQGQETRGAPGPQPQAADMMMLAWDDELAAVAQRLADQCVFAHDKCRNVPRFAVGQNIAWMGGYPSADWPLAVRMWFDEVKYYNRQNINPFKFSEKTGHYTQAVWARSSLVGCGYTRYKKKGNSMLQHLYVCNYAPVGNIMGYPLYVVGPAASKCPAGTSSSGNNGYPGLCS